MNARRVSAAAGVVLAAQKQRQTPAGIAAALEAAGLLQSPESAAELDRLSDELTGANLAQWEDGQEIDRLRLALKAAQRGRRQQRARVAELEAARTTAAADRDQQIIAWLVQKGREEGTSNKDSRVRATATYRLADKLSRGAVRPACPPVSPEDPHDSPLHHLYAVGRDLPEVTPDPLAYGPSGYRCGCGKDAHSNLTPCAPDGAL
ncbi:hypothetical protein ACFV1U_03600 [Streptomyces microflavus]|uniref:hypothetical protein n=1 Tax=Streptomyces microflavus TaxID=1919 RepID=UPI0036896431